ncbi:hypothetical protein P4493_04870 [Bacillus thuringiensis]|uniref:Membrane protein n=3 Tax=Bacillus thuringiensis TaxID=1428 RepID=A0A0B5NC56_BACTU|nr:MULTISPECIES: hypothetical protein [Bacillus]MEC2536202.1 hypothetical protein [Bacillus cereus]MED1153674.1 hypothetical protein [Bacillus paranthracis]OUB09449.1 hypothetical protein BK708_33565 [Bacillus thuringiensis serovar yunnanensis]AFQ29995.1 hypothetical protein BTF1_29472 [Bacillus thuringiensis HD-789]AJG73975.1 putative membrane protein [Bacillus thuringiensis]
MNQLNFALFGVVVILLTGTSYLYYGYFKTMKTAENKNETAYAFIFGFIIFLITTLGLVISDHITVQQEKTSLLSILIVFLANGMLAIWVRGMYDLTKSSKYKTWVMLVRLVSITCIIIVGFNVYKVIG